MAYRTEDNLRSEFPKSKFYQDYDLVIKIGERRFQAILLKPKEKSEKLKPILAIRGTEPDSISSFLKSSLLNNFNEASVGENQFKENEPIIKELLEQAGDKVVLTCHSLGGAVAQIITANYPEKIEKLITFQSPGIDQKTVEKLKKVPKETRTKKIVHHIVKGDLVDLAGEEHLPGQFFEHNLDTYSDIIEETLSYLPLDIFKTNMSLYVSLYVSQLILALLGRVCKMLR